MTPIEIVQQPKSASAMTSTGADAVRECSDTEGSSELCVTVDGVIVDPSRALTATGEALIEGLNSGDAIAEAIREGTNDVAAAPLSAGPNGRAS